MVSECLQVVYVLPSVHSFKVWIHKLSVIWGLVPWVPPCPWSGSWVPASSCAHVATCQNIPIKPELGLHACMNTYQLYWSVLIILLLIRASNNICMLHFGNDVRGTCLHCLPGSLQWCRENGDSADFLPDWTVEFFNFQSISEKMLPPSPPPKKTTNCFCTYDFWMLPFLQQPHFVSALYNVWLF